MALRANARDAVSAITTWRDAKSLLKMASLRRLFHYLDDNMSAADEFALVFFVLWSLWLLVFVLDAAGAKFFGIALLLFGIICCALHRPIGWLQFQISRFLPPHSFSETGQEGAYALYLAFGLTMIGMGCIVLIVYCGYLVLHIIRSDI